MGRDDTLQSVGEDGSYKSKPIGENKQVREKKQSSVFHARSSPLTLVLLRSSGSPGNVIKMPCIHNNGTRINSSVFGNLQQALVTTVQVVWMQRAAKQAG